MAPLAVSLSSRPRVAMTDLLDTLALAAILRDLKILIRADWFLTRTNMRRLRH